MKIRAGLAEIVDFGFPGCLTAAVVGFVLVASPCNAASVDWTGFYAGANAGFATDRFLFPYAVQLPSGSFSGDSAITSAGPVAGLDVGYDYEFENGFLVGGVLDANWSNVSGSTTVSGGDGFKATFGTRERQSATARLKLGYAFGRWAPYVTAGFSLATARTTYSVSGPGGFMVSGGSTATRSGLFPHVGAVGLGLDYALTSQLSLQAEYLYNFINARYAMYTPAPSTVVGFNTREMYHVFRIGLAWKLD